MLATLLVDVLLLDSSAIQSFWTAPLSLYSEHEFMVWNMSFASLCFPPAPCALLQQSTGN